MQMSPFGVLTVAFGPERYRKQAVALAQSLQLHNPGWPRACMTEDANDPLLKPWFDILIPLKPEYGTGFHQKLHIDLYTPFEETLFIDSDCVAVRDLSFLVERLKPFVFTPLCIKAYEGWWYMDIPKMIRRFGLEFMPKFNGGIYYFRKNGSERFFRKARQIVVVDDRLNILDMRGSFGDEPIFAAALAYLRMPVYLDYDRTGMNTPAEFTDPFELNVLEGRCHFRHEGEEYHSSVAHFFGNYTSSYHYLREKYSLVLLYKGVPKALISMLRGLGNAFYFLFIKVYQLAQAVKGKRIRFNHSLPLLPLANFGTRFNKAIISKL